MRYPPEETAEKHKRILEEAARLFRERGFSRVSVSEIMKATGLTHGPFYNHFASKEALVSEALDVASSKNLDALDHIAAKHGLAGYLDRYLSRAHVEHAGEGCLISALATEVGKEPSAQPAFTKHVRASVDRIEALMSGQPEEARRAEAMRSLSAMIGAVLVARAVDDPALGDEFLAAVRQGLPE
jgi:TetR/AcrR family transcriptional regulator, transcriptional repressor for nem operon